jgi:PKD domain-containing protein
MTPVLPPDLSPPTITSQEATSPAPVGAGQSITPPSIAVTDDVAWVPASYTATVDWGDGSTTAVSFPGISAPSVPVSITLPPHIYMLPGSFKVSVTVVDPASHATTTTVTTATIVPSLVPGTGYPRLVGTPKVGRTLTCKPGNWGDDHAEIAFRWKVNGTRIPGFSDDTFRVRRRDQGRRLTCQVIQSNAAFVARATSNALRIRAVSRR